MEIIDESTPKAECKADDFTNFDKDTFEQKNQVDKDTTCNNIKGLKSKY